MPGTGRIPEDVRYSPAERGRDGAAPANLATDDRRPSCLAWITRNLSPLLLKTRLLAPETLGIPQGGRSPAGMYNSIRSPGRKSQWYTASLRMRSPGLQEKSGHGRAGIFRARHVLRRLPCQFARSWSPLRWRLRNRGTFPWRAQAGPVWFRLLDGRAPRANAESTVAILPDPR